MLRLVTVCRPAKAFIFSSGHPDVIIIIIIISNGNRTEWSPIRSVIIRVIKQESDLFNHEHDYRLYYIHFEITGYPWNLIGSQWCDLFLNRPIFCSKLHLFQIASFMF